ncbi:hypothetical protein CHISP_0369 [Chitinispirillum alkaliphilum]|nr:hypothetical protein CHISP_0369 [Chitinispirillum alkaliphilum]
MFRVPKISRVGLCIAVVTVNMLLLQCANPVDEEPLRWTSAMDLPITNHKFFLGEELENMFIKGDSLAIINMDQKFFKDTLKFDEKGNPIYADKPYRHGDSTLIFSYIKRDTTDFQIKEENIDDEIHHQHLGPLPLSSNLVTGTIPVNSGVQNLDLTPFGIHLIEFHSTSPTMSVVLTNHTGSTLSNVVASIAGAQSSSVSIPANGQATAVIPVAGRTFGNSVPVSVSATGGTGNVDVAFDFDGLLASSVQVNDNMLAGMGVSFNVDYDITDTVFMHYIDVLDGFYRYTIQNNTDLNLRVGGHHRDLWRSSFSISEGHQNRAHLGAAGFTRQDSLDGYFGTIIETNVGAGEFREFDLKNLSGVRMFPQWDPHRGECFTQVWYEVEVAPRGQVVTLNENDVITVTVSTGEYKFKEFFGEVMLDYEREGDTVYVEIPFPWHEGNKERLRGNFEFADDVSANIFVHTEMTQGSEMEHMEVEFRMVDILSQVSSDTNTVLNHVKNDTTFMRGIDITDVVNQFPDSIMAIVRVRVPAGTTIRAINDLIDPLDPDYVSYVGRLTVNANVTYQMNASLDWRVTNTFVMDLGIDTFSVPGELDIFRKMDDRYLKFNMWIRNNSNLNSRLYALIAPNRDNKMQELEAMTIDDVHNLITSGEAENHGFINLMSENGVFIPQRSTATVAPDSVFSSVELTHEQTELMFDSDTLSWRWLKTWYENPRDRASDTCNIKINSWLFLRGINNTDSLFIW